MRIPIEGERKSSPIGVPEGNDPTKISSMARERSEGRDAGLSPGTLAGRSQGFRYQGNFLSFLSIHLYILLSSFSVRIAFSAHLSSWGLLHEVNSLLRFV